MGHFICNELPCENFRNDIGPIHGVRRRVTFLDSQPEEAKICRLEVRMEPEANSAARNKFVVARTDNGNVRELREFERDPGSLIRRNRYGDLVRVGAFDVARIHGGDHVVVDLAVRHCGI